MVSESDIERFEEKYITEPNSGCWLWDASALKSGYGQFWLNNKMIKAHRVSYSLYKGSIPTGMHVLHSCDVPCCVNPAHLYLGTHQDNMDDKVRKGRTNSLAKEEHPLSKLTEKQVSEIRDLLKCGLFTQRKIADFYSAHESTVSNIKLGKQWREYGITYSIKREIYS